LICIIGIKSRTADIIASSRVSAVRAAGTEVQISMVTDRDQRPMQDGVNLMLAILLIISPWVLGCALDLPAAAASR
jgi:ABC-type molybdate transport system permease subunit